MPATSLDLIKILYLCPVLGVIAQLARVLQWHCRGRGFDSHWLHRQRNPRVKTFGFFVFLQDGSGGLYPEKTKREATFR